MSDERRQAIRTIVDQAERDDTEILYLHDPDSHEVMGAYLPIKVWLEVTDLLTSDFVERLFKGHSHIEGDEDELQEEPPG